MMYSVVKRSLPAFSCKHRLQSTSVRRHQYIFCAV